MTDEIKELLTLAAKACGMEVEWGKFVDPNMDSWYGFRKCGVLGSSGEHEWAPHLDDGDGARMETTVRIEVEWHSLGVASSVYNDRLPRSWADPVVRVREAYADHGGNRQAARRWASLRAAAQVGRGML